MELSDQGFKLITEREGCSLKPYQDSVGVWTDGYGNTHGVVPNGPPISQEKADEDLRNNLKFAEAAIRHNVNVQIPQYSHDSLASFIFNVGQGAFAGSTVLRRINAGDMAGAASAFDMWHIPPEITSRRNGEREQFKGTRFEARIP